jgi:hypothetical protein
LDNGRTVEDNYFTCDTCGEPVDYKGILVRIESGGIRIHRDYHKYCVPKELLKYITGESNG